MKFAEADRSVSRREMLRFTAVAGISVALGIPALQSLIRTGRLHHVERSSRQLGTIVSLSVVHPERDIAQAMVGSAFLEMERLESILSRHRTDTSVARLNRDGNVSDAPTELTQVLRRALEFSKRTEGAFDVTMKPLLDLFASRIRNSGLLPEPQEIEEARSRVGYSHLEVDGETIRLLRPGMGVTLDGIGKGFVVDATLALLQRQGASRVFVDGGGDIAVRGRGANGAPWSVGIQDPNDLNGLLGMIRLGQGGVATSGDYVQTLTSDRRYHHIIDPRTGKSPRELSSVSVVAPTAVDADALSTSAMVLGVKQGLSLLEQSEGVEGMLVTKGGETVVTSGFRKLLRSS